MSQDNHDISYGHGHSFHTHLRGPYGNCVQPGAGTYSVGNTRRLAQIQSWYRSAAVPCHCWTVAGSNR